MQIAIVGNGKLTKSQQNALNSPSWHLVYRIDDMPCMRAGDRIDVHIFRESSPISPYECFAKRRIRVPNKSYTHSLPLHKTHRFIFNRGILIPKENEYYWETLVEKFEEKSEISTPWSVEGVALLLAAEYHRNDDVHLFGFIEEMDYGKEDSERAILEYLQDNYSFNVHPTSDDHELNVRDILRWMFDLVMCHLFTF